MNSIILFIALSIALTLHASCNVLLFCVRDLLIFCLLALVCNRGYMLHRKRRGEVEFGILLQRLRTSSKHHLAAWLAHTRKCCRMRKLGVSMLLRVLGRYRARAFLCWKEFCEGLSTMGAKYANLLARGYTCCLADHFQAWSEHKSRNRRSLSHVMVRTISTLLHSQR